MKYLITLIIPTFNRPNDLQKCLISVVNSTRKPDEVIIVDDAGKYDLSDIVKEILVDKIEYKIIKNEKNVGHSTSRNIGIKNSKGDLIFFLDDDCEVLPDYFLEIEKIYLTDKEEKIGGIEGIIINDGSQEISPIDSFFTKFFMLNGIDKTSRIFPSGNSTQSNEEVKTIEVEILMGAASFRKKVYTDFKYNENFSGWSPDDQEFSYRVSKKYKLLHHPKAKLYHYHVRQSRESEILNYSKRVWMHYIIWRRCVDLSFINSLCFIWSEIGFLLYNIICIFRHRALSTPIKRIFGLFFGYFITIKLIFDEILKKKEFGGKFYE